jgi:hypothetical protein
VKESGFDHGQTRYPLRGKHAAVPCASCHDPKRAWGAKPAFASCVSCHRDAHAGQATLAGRPADCAACHDERGFETSLYTAEQHRASAYPLEGAHARSQCALCHAKAADGAEAARLGSARVRMRPAHDACITCHRDPHDGRFPAARSAARQDACLACHSMTAFRPSQVSLAAHARYAYALTGAHRAVPCQACHAELSAAPSRGSLKASAPGRALRFEDSRRRCAECHPGPHGEQFAARADGGACESCHDDSAWLPASGFDHARDAAYRLDGAHVKVACSGCHPSVRGADGKVRVIYRPISHACETCHRTTPPKGDGAWLPESRRGAAASAKLFATHEVTHVQRTF